MQEQGKWGLEGGRVASEATRKSNTYRDVLEGKKSNFKYKLYIKITHLTIRTFCACKLVRQKN